jgi:hypothetical protein
MSTLWRQWLTGARVTDDPVGDFIGDARTDRRMLDEMASLTQLQGYLRCRGACPEALATAPAAFGVSFKWRAANEKEKPTE